MAVSIYVPTALRNFTGGNESVAVEARSEEHTSELQSQSNLVCRLLLEKKKIQKVDPSKFTEVRYVGRDGESMIRDLTELPAARTRQETVDEYAAKEWMNADEGVLALGL